MSWNHTLQSAAFTCLFLFNLGRSYFRSSVSTVTNQLFDESGFTSSWLLQLSFLHHHSVRYSRTWSKLSYPASIGSKPRRRNAASFAVRVGRFWICLRKFLKYNSRFFVSPRRRDTISRPYNILGLIYVSQIFLDTSGLKPFRPWSPAPISE